ncbi:MAG: stage V sporulation protein AD [Bacilli bacterium]|nr:stage V sporulation protein AD [Bacilli bacterium]MCI9434218.1 stage V sporulation protein AD [Bacilli bacterium]
MTIKFDNVYISDTGTVTGPYEKNGPLQSYFDKSYNDFYFGLKTWEQAESKLIEDSVDILLNKIGRTRFDIDLHISGDLMNQLTSSNYAASKLGIPYLGIYNACATSTEGLIIGSSLVDKKIIKNCICSVSSHNNSAEKQFRYPIEYGGPKRKTTTFTTTGGASAYLSSEKKGIRIESGTIGSVIDMGIKDVYNMGAVMAPAAAQTIYEHLRDTKREIDYYDLVLTGDLGIYGKKILKEYMETEYNIKLKNYDDTACMIFDLDNQPVYAGASGPACAPLVTYGYIFNKMKKKEINRVLLVATGALMSPTMVNEKMTIPSIAHAISLEVIE